MTCVFNKEDKVAIIGPLPGEVGYSRDPFTDMEKVLERYGCEVLSPLRHGEESDYATLVGNGSMDIAMCTHVVLLDGWEPCNGPCNLKGMARKQNKPIVNQYQLVAHQKGWKP